MQTKIDCLLYINYCLLSYQLSRGFVKASSIISYPLSVDSVLRGLSSVVVHTLGAHIAVVPVSGSGPVSAMQGKIYCIVARDYLILLSSFHEGVW